MVERADQTTPYADIDRRPHSWDRRPRWVDYAITILLEAGITVGLLALQPIFPLGQFPAPYFLLNMVVAYALGEGPAIVAFAMGWALFTRYFVPHPGVLWPPAISIEGWTSQAAFLLGTSTVTIAAIQTRKWNRRVQRLADEATALNVSLREQMAEREQAVEALRESEERFRTLFDSLPVGAVLIDPNSLHFPLFNETAPRNLGYTREEFAEVGLLDIEILHDEALIRQNMARFVSGEKLEFETELRTKAGEPRDVLVRGQGLHAGEEPLALAIWMDITERKQAEQEIRALNAELEQRVMQRTAELEESNKELEAFSYSVSHDLRAPLRAVDGFSNALLKGYLDRLDERGQDYLRRVRAAAQRMAQLIDDVLGLSRAGRAEMHPQRVDLSAMVREILDDLRKSQPERKVEAQIEPDMAVTADPHLIRIALDNLLANAWKFTANRDLARIHVGSVEQDGERVYFVRDNGAGFDPRYADKLFSPFQRLHSEAEFPGTGIGLALVQRIIRRHGARIWAEGAVDEGAAFYFTLPEVET
jgi:PAS domain S-box-containing protein